MHQPRKKKSFDPKILIGLLAIIVVAAGILLFKYLTREECPIAVTFDYNGETFNGSEITFYDQTEGAVTWLWDFKDGTETSSERSPKHTFAEGAVYRVELTVNGKCKGWKEIVIESMQVEIPQLILPTAVISGPVNGRVEEKLTFNDNTEGATIWEWMFGESSSVDATTKNPTWVYKTPGKYKVTCVVNGASIPGTHMITINPKPDSGGGSKDYNKLTPTQLISMLKKIAQRKLDSNKLFPYFCNDLSVPIILPDGEQQYLSVYCLQIRNIGEVEASSATIERDSETKCITKVTLK